MTDSCESGQRVEPHVLAGWLVAQGYAEEARGYGHVTGEDLAEALLSRFHIADPEGDADAVVD
jgi:hypothetical protein